jgi:hypothetical protein
MASAAEYSYIQTVAKAEGVRQGSVAAAYATFSAAGFTPAAFTTYNSAVATARQAYITAVQSAMATLGETLDTYGLSGPIGGNIANLINGY